MRAQDPIAIVGVACRFPGGANDEHSFWDLLRNGTDAITVVPADRWNAARFHHEDASAPGRIVSKWGGFVSNADAFDAAFFGIAPREAARMDPQQRWLAEVTWEAIENAGLPPERLAGSRTGVFVGISHSDYATLLNDLQAVDGYVNSGVALSIAANRLSFLFDFRGPSMAVDTACSSSLVALHLAAQSLRSGDCTYAIVGAANSLLSPESSIGFSQARMLSPRGRCRTFDSSADGYVRAEGAGAVLLMPLSRARELGLQPRAILVATATNQDGRSSSLTAPNQKAQEEMILGAMRDAEVDPNDIVYVEAHGTGTPVGDRIEIRAVASTIAKDRPADQPLLIGSVKTNIGHLEPASGMAGLIKSVLVLEHRLVPPNLHFERPNPKLPAQSMKVPTVLTPLPEREGTPLVAVNSFGFGGANAHAILAPAPAEPSVVTEHRPPREAHILALSARNREALVASIHEAAQTIERGETDSLEELCAAFALQKAQHPVRAAFVADSLTSLAAELRASSGVRPHAVRPKIAFVFCGQGTQWWAMGRQLYQRERVVRDTWQRCEEICPGLMDALLADETHSRLDHTDVAQPALFALQAGLVALWRTYGIDPDMVIGHSVGEAAAAWAAAAFELEDMLRLIMHRSRAQERTRGGGRMLAVSMSEDDASGWVRKFDGRVAIAAVNAPQQLTLSGDERDLHEISASLERSGVFCRFLPGSYAFHSAQMDPIEEMLRGDFASTAPAATKIPMISTVTGQQVGGQELNASYWWRNVRQPVRFASAIEQALRAGCNTFLEVGPHPVLASSLAEIALRAGADVSIVGSLRRGQDERQTTLSALATLYVKGSDVRWDAIYKRPSRRLRLPSYPWQRQRLWHEASAVAEQNRIAPPHPLLGDRQNLSQPTWINQLNARVVPWLSDHRVGGTVVVPAAAYLDMAAAAVREVHGDTDVFLEHVRFQRVLFIPREQSVRTCVRLDPSSGSFEILAASAADPATLVVHADGVYRRGRLHQPAAVDLEKLRTEFDDCRNAHDVYRELDAMGQTYGTAFRGLQSLLLRGNTRALGIVRDPVERESPDYVLFPPSLDSCFHPAVALKDEHGKPDRAVIVVSLRQMRLFRPLPEKVWSHVRIIERSGNSHVGDFTIYDDQGAVVAQAHGLCVQEVEREKNERALDHRMYELSWIAADPPAYQIANEEVALVIPSRSEGSGRRLKSDLHPDPSRSLGMTVAALLRARGIHVTESPSAKRVIYLGEDLHDLLALNPIRCLVVTQRAQPVHDDEEIDPQQATLWGFARTIQTERPQWNLSLIDVGDDSFAEEIVRELYATEIEPEVALRSDGRRVRRLSRTRYEAIPANSSAPAYELRVAQPGRPDTLAYVGRPRRRASSGEVEVKIAAAGINFRDVMKVLGIYPTDDDAHLGDEFSGTITSTGERVMGFAPGGGAFGSHIVVPAESVWKIPEGMSFADAATIPVAFGTAYHALHNLARLRRGETILVHAAAGGVGLAAVQLARQMGAHVMATAGSDRKRAYLESLGCALVLDSRSLDFADEVLRFTNGRGVDVVLNSLAGDFQQKSLEVCAPLGRFVEIGKRDLFENHTLPLAAFQKGLAFFAFDLGSVLSHGGAAARALRRFLRTHRMPLPATTFAAGDVASAFRTMQEAEHIGKLVIDMESEAQPALPAEFWPDPSGTYLVTGGLSGFGLATAKWLVERGARHLLLISRRGQASAEDAPIVDAMRERGATVTCVAADVADAKRLAEVISAIPLRGVFHCAMVLRDRALQNMSREDIDAVLAPKLAGAWNLHAQTSAQTLDCFVMYSSIAAIFGSAGQANYAAANASLDALAHERRRLGLPALSVNWGPIADVGVAAAHPEITRYLESTGVRAITSSEALGALATLIPRTDAQACVADVNWSHLGRAAEKFAESPIFRDLVEAGETRGGEQTPDAWRDALLRLAPEEQTRTVSETIVAHVAAVTRTPAVSVDRSNPLEGLDSLMAVELKFRIENETGCDLPIDVLNANLALDQLAERFLRQIASATPSRAAQPLAFEESRSEIDAPFLTKVSEPLVDLVQAGNLDRLTAAALMSWPDELFERTGVNAADFFRRMNGGRVSFDLIVETPVGSTGIFMLPLMTSQITPVEPALIPHVMDAIRRASACGARCIALTGLIPPATNYGATIRAACEEEKDLASVTTGHGTTIAAVILNLAAVLEETGRDLDDETVLIYGVGSIGLGALRLMLDVLPHPAELRLCDPYRSRQFFDELIDTLRREHGFRGSIDVGDHFEDATVIIGATNAANVLDVRRLAPGALIVDDSAPHCLNGPAALERFTESHDILCTEGGFVRSRVPMPRVAHVSPSVAAQLPEQLPQLLFSMLSPHDITACVLSALLSARRPDLPPTVGPVDAAVARHHWNVLAELGFAAASLNYEGTPLPRRSVDLFKERFGKSGDAMTAAAGE